MHDALRDVAISNLNERHGFKVMAQLSDAQTFENYSAISLISNDTKSLPGQLPAPKLQAFRIQSNSQLQIPEDFFQGSKDQLKLLEMSGIHFLPKLPSSLQPLSETLRTLHLTSCKLEDISMIGTLHKLEILSFCGSEIVEIPVHIAKLTCLKLLDLTNCEKLTNIAADISKLPDLEELYLPEFFKFANLVGLNSLSRLTCLQIFIPIDQALLPIDLLGLAQKLTSFNITISIVKMYTTPLVYKPKPYVGMGSLRICHDGPIQPLLLDWVKLLLKKTKYLVLDKLKNSNKIFSELNEEGFNELKSLELNFLEGTKYLVNTKGWIPQVAFRRLEVLSINGVRTFIEICPGQLPDQSFCNVRELHVDKCINMHKLVSSSLLVRLKYLEKLRVKNCGRLVHVFEEMEDHVVEEGLLSNLKEIEIHLLFKMKDIWAGIRHQSISLGNLEKVCVSDCSQFTTLFSPMLLKGLVRLKYLDIRNCNGLEVVFGHDEEEATKIALPCLRSLTHVSVAECRELRCLFSASIVQGDFEKLENLKVHGGIIMQNVIEDKKGEQEAASVEKKIIFPSLSSMSLQRLFNFKSFCTGRYTIEWPSLESLDISYCHKIQTFGGGDQVTPQLKKIVKTESEGRQEIQIKDNLNDVVKNHFGPKPKQLDPVAAGPSHTSLEAGPSHSSL